MTVRQVLLFPNPKGSFEEKEIVEVENALSALGIQHLRYTEGEDFEADAVIALGGDGTMLRASTLAYGKGLPIMSINFGTLGYMSCLEKSELHLLSALKSGFETEDRMLISVCAERDGEIIACSTALNEAVITRRPDGDIALLELKCDGSAVCEYRADGIIIATPTGSSAYAMSAGGPIIDTKLEAMCVCPICPHVLSSRAMVFSSHSVIEAVNLNRKNGEGNLLLADGKIICELKQGDLVRAVKATRSLKLIKLKKDAFYETLYKKMS